jgi:hypothetical protein
MIAICYDTEVMPRVVPYEAIAFLPQKSDFERAVEQFQAGATHLVEEGVIAGAFIHGSAAIRATTPLSDIDAVVALRYDSPISRSQVRDLTYGIIAYRPVDLLFEPLVKDVAALATGFHSKDRFFGAHLKAPDRLIIGEDPAAYMRFRDDTAHDILKAYLAHKVETSSDAHMATGRMAAEGRGLQRVIELPKTVGRKTLQAVMEVQGSSNKFAYSDPATYLKSAEIMFDDNGLGDEFRYLQGYEGSYRQMVSRVKAGDISKGSYYGTLSEMREDIPRAIRWLNSVAETFLPKLQLGNQ